MTQEEKIEEAKRLYKTANADQKYLLECLFPELFVSEDERIRKALIRYHQSTLNIDGIKGEEILAWLEKQGKQKTFDYENADVQQKDFAPKAEPKFKVGDWVVYNNQDTISPICQITKIDGDIIDLKGLRGERFQTEYWDLKENYHLWTIQDAKDGDVLISQYNKPFIYNGNLNSFHIGSYCGISIEGRFNVAIEKCRWTENRNIYPATKEQRDILFEKMREAGYEWEEDKKELNKIEKQGEKEEVDGFDAELNALLKKYEHLSKEELQEPLEFYLGVVRDDLDIVREEKSKWTDE